MTRLGGGVGVDGVPRKSSPEMTKTEESSTVRPVDAEKGSPQFHGHGIAPGKTPNSGITGERRSDELLKVQTMKK